MVDWTPNIGLLQAFDDGEWSRVERGYTGRLLAYVARRVVDAQAREDIVQDAFLGAVRGIPSFDSMYTFEQYLFGICRNRTIDYLRRRKAAQWAANEDDDDRSSALDQIAQESETPSTIVRQEDIRGKGRKLLFEILRDWVQETWQAGEFKRLMVIEALLAAGWRNRDTWEHFGLRDETAVAGIKFRALKRLRELAAQCDPASSLLPALADETEAGGTGLEVGTIWRENRVSCPARHWIARDIAGTLDEGPAAFLKFHLEQMGCEWCQANRDDLSSGEADLEPLLERVRASTAAVLRSRTVR